MQTSSGAGLTFMVVDDNPDIAEVFGFFLRHCGMKVIFAHNIKECVFMLQFMEVDGMIADHLLPDGKGGDLPAILGDKFPKVSFLITGYCGDLESQYPGFTSYMRKPVSLEVLHDAVKQYTKEVA